MADGYNEDMRRSDAIAKTLAIIGIIVALTALVWAMKADNRAGEAENKIDQRLQQTR